MRETYRDVLDFYQRGRYAPYLETYRLAGSSPVGMISARYPPGQFPEPAFPHATLCIAKRIASAGEMDAGAGRWRGRFRAGDIALVPPGSASDFFVEDSFELLVLPITAESSLDFGAELAPDRLRDFGWLHAGPFQDPLIETLIQRLWEEAAGDAPLGRLFADSALHTLAVALLRKAGQIPADPAPLRGTPMAARRLKRCLDYLAEHLNRPIGLGELAAVADLSPLYFAKAFKRATGLAPHQYLIRQRLQRAKELLADSDLPLVEIALACGFADQNHFGNTFKRHVGLTPGRYRDRSR